MAVGAVLFALRHHLLVHFTTVSQFPANLIAYWRRAMADTAAQAVQKGRAHAVRPTPFRQADARADISPADLQALPSCHHRARSAPPEIAPHPPAYAPALR